VITREATSTATEKEASHKCEGTERESR